MNWKRAGKVIAIILVSLLLIDFAVGNYLYSMVIKRGPKDFLQGNDDLEVSAEAMDVFLAGDWRGWTREQNFKKLELITADGIQLEGNYLEAKEPTSKLVIFAHGYSGNSFDMGIFSEFYYEELGYNLFIPDLRGHGNSEGDYIGFGWPDRLDLIEWIDLLVADEKMETDIYLHGLSMGAATVLMMSGEDLPHQVKGIVADSPYTSVYDLFAYQLKRMYHLPAAMILPAMSVVTKVRADYSLTEASALEQVKQAQVPILYIHGAADTFVPYEMSETLSEQTNSEHELVLFSDANHGESIVLHEEKYYQTVSGFLESIQ